MRLWTNQSSGLYVLICVHVHVWRLDYSASKSIETFNNIHEEYRLIMTLTHTVLFQFKSDVDLSEIKEVRLTIPAVWRKPTNNPFPCPDLRFFSCSKRPMYPSHKQQSVHRFTCRRQRQFSRGNAGKAAPYYCLEAVDTGLTRWTTERVNPWVRCHFQLCRGSRLLCQIGPSSSSFYC